MCFRYTFNSSNILFRLVGKIIWTKVLISNLHATADKTIPKRIIKFRDSRKQFHLTFKETVVDVMKRRIQEDIMGHTYNLWNRMQNIEHFTNRYIKIKQLKPRHFRTSKKSTRRWSRGNKVCKKYVCKIDFQNVPRFNNKLFTETVLLGNKKTIHINRPSIRKAIVEFLVIFTGANNWCSECLFSGGTNRRRI